MGFPPKGVPPLESTFFAVRQAQKGGFRKGVEGETSGGKTKRFARPLCCGRTAAPEVERKRRAEEKRETAQVVSLFLCSPPVCFYTLKR